MNPSYQESLLLSDATFIVVDLETTGGSPRNGCAITEIGAVKVRGGEVLDSFETFVNPLSPIPPFITELTGITNEMVSRAPIIDEVLPELFTFFGSHEDSILVAHNSPFDMGFLMAAAEDCDLTWPSYLVIDTVRLARRLLDRDDVIDCKLSTLAEFFSTEVQPTHRALDDARTTVDVLHGLIERTGTQGISTVAHLNHLLKQKSIRGKSY